MIDEKQAETLEEMLENDEQLQEIAALCHSQWSGWMHHLFMQCSVEQNGDATIPRYLVEQWQRQMKTPYKELLPNEKVSDQKEAMKFVSVFRQWTKGCHCDQVSMEEVDGGEETT